MKPPLTNELKAKYFSGYHNARVCIKDYNWHLIGSEIYNDQIYLRIRDWDDKRNFWADIDDSVIQLRDIISLKDEELQLIWNCYIENSTPIIERNKNNIHLSMNTIDLYLWADFDFICDDSLAEINFQSTPIEVYQLLQSFHIALPFMGYSVDKLEAAGWIKIMEDEA